MNTETKEQPMISPLSRVWLEINLETLRNNFIKIKTRVNPCKVVSVLKANAYGLGVQEIAKTLADAGTDAFGVAELNEALSLVKLGKPIQILGSILKTEIPLTVENNIILPITDIATACLINIESKKQNKVSECHILIDSGMGRLGIQINNALDDILEIVKNSNIKCTGIYSHFPIAYKEGCNFTENQVTKFSELISQLEQKNIVFNSIHIANSDAINNVPNTFEKPFNYIRTGINLHGSFDPEGKHTLDVRSILTLKTKLVCIRTLPKGSTIGYGLTCKLKKETKIGTISAGYADGIPLALSNNGFVIINGRKCPILGRISMDYTTISLDECLGAKIGDEVICLGGDTDNSPTVEDWARAKKTHAYEVICSFGTRVERKYIS